MQKPLQLSDQKGGFALTVRVKANGNPFAKSVESSQRSNGEKREERYENLGGNDQSEILPLIIGENNYSPDIQVDKVEIDGNKV